MPVAKVPLKTDDVQVQVPCATTFSHIFKGVSCCVLLCTQSL